MPLIWDKCKYVCEKQDYMNYKLTGEYVASGCNVNARYSTEIYYSNNI